MSSTRTPNTGRVTGRRLWLAYLHSTAIRYSFLTSRAAPYPLALSTTHLTPHTDSSP